MGKIQGPSNKKEILVEEVKTYFTNATQNKTKRQKLLHAVGC